ncbi:MAG: JAB domain-containing protein, partial [Alphaproteobacteria bacterium]|nr:JAB domain-containing protein [Alphaproteobacteria bacterium]
MSDRAEESSRAKAHYEGHRDRLRARLVEKGTETLADYELLELLLFAAIPRRDVKPLAKKLIADHKDFYGVLTASHAQLTASGLSDNTACFLCAVGAAGLRSRKKTIINQPILSSWQRVVDYCRHAMAHESKEQFRLLFLDRRNRLIAEEVQQRG